jgi:regulator of sigma E protease
MLNIILFLLVLGFLIFIHELGHFLFAKKLKVPVEEFAIGFPPNIFRKKFKDTVYSLNLFFLGGYVKLRGENDPQDIEGFLNKPPLVKILVTIAGVVFNIVLAYFLFSIGYLIGMPEYSQDSKNIVILQVFPNTVAEKSDLKIFDRLLYLKTENEIINFNKIEDVRKILENFIDKEILLGIERKGEIKEIKLTPKKQNNLGPLGVRLGTVDIVKYNFPLNFYFGLIKTKNSVINFFLGIKDFFVRLIAGQKEALKEVVGPLGIYDIYNQFKALGINYLIFFIAIISLNLAIINILPIPALDGGRFVFYFYELLTQKKINPNFENIVNIAGFVFLIVLMILITIKDIISKIQ